MSQINNIDYNALVSNHTIISRTDLKGIITYVNDNFCALSGYAYDELIGQSHNIVRHPDVSSKLYEELWSTIQNNQIWSGNIRNIAKNGEEYYIKSTIIPLLDEFGNKEGYMSLHYKITEEKVEKLQLKKQLYLYKSENVKRSKEIFQSMHKQKQLIHLEYQEKYTALIHSLENELHRLRHQRKQDVQNISCLEDELKFKKSHYDEFKNKSKKMILNLSTERVKILERLEQYKKSNNALEIKLHKAQEGVVVFQGYIDEYRKKIEDLNDVINSYEKEKMKTETVHDKVNESQK